MPRHQTKRAGNPGGSRPNGFAFLLVLMLLMVATIIIAASLQRSSMHNTVVERQLEGYRRQHEMLGVRDIAELWLLRREAKDLVEFADSPEPAHRLALENGVVILIYVRDGQGTINCNMDLVAGEDLKRWVAEVVGRLPPERTDLVRRVGSWQISLRSAPDEVLDAIAGGDPGVADALRQARDKRIKNVSELLQILERAGADALASQVLARYITFDPVLWRLDIEAVHPDSLHRYTVLAEKRANMPALHEWRAVEDEAEIKGFGPDAPMPWTGRTGVPRGPGKPKTVGR